MLDTFMIFSATGRCCSFNCSIVSWGKRGSFPVAGALNVVAANQPHPPASATDTIQVGVLFIVLPPACFSSAPDAKSPPERGTTGQEHRSCYAPLGQPWRLSWTEVHVRKGVERNGAGDCPVRHQARHGRGIRGRGEAGCSSVSARQGLHRSGARTLG